MRRIGVSMQQAHGDGGHAFGLKVGDDRVHRIRFQRREHFALVRHPFAHLATQVTGHEGRRLGVAQVEEVGPVAAGDFQHVAKAEGGDEAGLGALALGQRVDDHRRAVGKKSDAALVQGCPVDGGEHAFLEIRWRGVRLDRVQRRDPAARLIDFVVHQIREGAPHIGRHAQLRGIRFKH